MVTVAVVMGAVVYVHDTRKQQSHVEYKGENKGFSSTFLEKLKEIVGGLFVISAYFISSLLKPGITSAHDLDNKDGC